MRTHRSVLFASIAAAAWLCASVAAAATPVTLRPTPMASGAAVTLGDLFEGAGAAAGEPIAPAPPLGQTAPLSARFVAAAAQAAGLDWTPPPGLDRIEIGRAGSARAASARAISAGAVSAGGASFTPAAAGASPRADQPRAAADVAVRRGDMINLAYDAPGIRITMRAKALDDGSAGETIRVQNIQSARSIEARVTAAGAAAALGPIS